MAKKVMTAALAIVISKGIPIAKIKSLQISETIQRGSVRGLGSLTKSEVPPTAVDCTASFDFYNVDLLESSIPGANPREFQTVKEWSDNLLLMDGVQVEIYKKVTDFIDPVTKLVKAKKQIFATIQDMFIDSDRWSLSEGQVSDKSQNFQYLTPILFQV